MTFEEILDQAAAMLRRRGRVTYRTLKLQFQLDEEHLEALKEELIDGQRLAADENGRVLVWVGQSSPESRVQSLESKTFTPPDPRRETLDPRPIDYTPAHLAERIRAEQAALEARGATDGERKTITALFADLKGSTALIEGLDPEEARAIIDPALQLMMDAVHQYEGYVAQALGDGIFALFGAPIAHEDHPQRALYAALRMQDEMRRYADTLRAKGYPPLLMRVGVNTGEVVVRSIRKDDLHTDYVPVGHSTNLAARMEQLATPGSILVTAYTHRLTDGYFAFKDLGKTQIKGVEEPLSIYEVLGTGPLRTRLQVSVRRGLTRFVGRHSEMEQLQQALAQAKAGHGQIIGVMGEPGLGKSRLFYEFKLLSLSGCLVLEAYSVSHGKASPYLPVIELLKGYFDIQAQDEERKRREKVTGKVLTLDRNLEDTLPYLFALLGIEEQPSSLQQMDAQIRRRRTFEALKKLFLRESLNQPLILIFEDLHWIDGETQGFLDVLGESVASAKILLLTNYRPEYRHEWGQKTYYTQLRLVPLGKAEAEALLTFLLGSDASLKPVKALILEKTEGTPFFMEEVVQTLVEDGTLTGAPGQYHLTHHASTQHVLTLHISPTAQGVLAARIDRLMPDEKSLLQQLSVIGREFPLGLVQQIVTQPEDEIYRLLSSLQRKEFLYEQPAFPEVEYIFKHALTQEVAYNSVLIERRKTLHEQIAQAMEHLYKDNLDEHYSDLAHHYIRSSNTEKAIEYLHLAGQQAVQRSANVEAITYLTAALDLLTTVPDTRERAQQELTLQIALGPALIITMGYGTPEVEQLYTRARDLCQKVGDAPQLFSVLFGLYTFYFVQMELQTTTELGKQCLSLAQSMQNQTFLLGAHWLRGLTLYSLGEFAPAREHFQQSLVLYDSQQRRSYALIYAQDPGVGCSMYAALVLWQLGYPDQALRKVSEALASAQELSQPFSLGLALNWAATFHQFRGEDQLAQEQTEASISFSIKHGLPFSIAWATILRGWALSKQGQKEEGIAQIRQGMIAMRATKTEIWRPYYLALLAEAYGKGKQAEAGLKVLVEALALVGKTGECWWEAELYRLKGELIHQQFNGQDSTFTVENPQSAFLNPQLEAEACFLKAIEIAQKQQAKSLELRATVSLARLWQQQGKRAEAYTMLAEIYNWFIEGFETKDMQEAKVLLEKLA
jgi:class 3 adenylate cyclase/predicted ATPase